MSYYPMEWTAEMDAKVRDGIAAKLAKDVIASELGISRQSVSRRADVLGLGNGSWTEQEIEILKIEWPTGSPASQIALLLNNKSRNAVIGKAHRLNLGKRLTLSGNAIVKKTPKPRPPRKHRKRGATPQEGDMIKSKVTAPIRYPEPKPLSAKPPISIMELGEDTCRAIVGRGGPPHWLAVYCGDEVFPGKSFCEGHCALYFDYDRKRRRG